MGSPPQVRNAMRETEYNHRRFGVRLTERHEAEAEQRRRDNCFIRLLAMAYMRGEFPKDMYPGGKPPLILT